MKELVYTISQEAGLDIEIITDRTKPQGRFIKSADSRLLRAAIGGDFEFEVSFKEGIRRMLGWYDVNFNQN